VPFVTSLRVRFYELDPYDHVNHAAYVQYFEVARIELLESVGMGLIELKGRGIHLVVTELRTRFLSSAGSGDLLTVDTEVAELRRVSTRWRQRLLRDGELLAEQEIVVAATTVAGRPTRVPGDLIEAISPYAS
jgi:acyl-CoA thioester hydrolase